MLVVIILYSSQVIRDWNESNEVNHMNILKKHVLGRGNSKGKGFELGYAWHIGRMKTEANCGIRATGEEEMVDEFREVVGPDH